jgi:hypothetical protein
VLQVETLAIVARTIRNSTFASRAKTALPAGLRGNLASPIMGVRRDKGTQVLLIKRMERARIVRMRRRDFSMCVARFALLEMMRRGQ